MRELISFGFSCQTQFSIDQCHIAHGSLPFDWNITTKEFLIGALRSDGESFLSDQSELSIFKMAIEGTHGVRKRGVFFWHDFIHEGKIIEGGWRHKINNLNDKYAYLWRKLRESLRDECIEKQIIISNSQNNLSEFTKDDNEFKSEFGIDHEFASLLIEELRAYGARNFRVLFLMRDIGDVVKIRSVTKCGISSHRFVGVMNLPTNRDIAYSFIGRGQSDVGVSALCGRYDNGSKIDRWGDNAAMVTRRSGEPWGEVTAFPGGYLAVFSGAADAVFRAMLLHGNELHFSNNTVWKKI